MKPKQNKYVNVKDININYVTQWIILITFLCGSALGLIVGILI